jgi:predicted nucleic acid-binding protein
MRYLIDTVTLSELRRAHNQMHPSVWAWQKHLRKSYLSVITLNEIRYGIKKVESRDPIFSAQLSAWYSLILARPKHFRIMPVDRAIAELAADFRAAHDTPFEDSLIAATAKMHGLILATRNIVDFQACGIKLVNPWEHEE